jgi:amidase
MDDTLGTQPAGALEKWIVDKTISSRELLDCFLQRIERINPDLNAAVTVQADQARAAAEAADEMTARGDPLGPLHGLPITIKDAIEVSGMRSTGGSRALAEHVPSIDAPAVARLKQAGAIVFGKTNVPEWSGDVQTFNELFGTTNNPWDTTRTTGGSSGGAAAAVASGLTSFEMGTDIGGSVRIPSSFCGVFGHKPSFGVVSQRGYLDRVDGGVIDADINVFGPIARAPSDLDLLLRVLVAPNEEYAKGWSLSLPASRHTQISQFRVGAWLDDAGCPVDTEVLDALSGVADALARAGARVSSAHPPVDFSDAYQLFNSLIVSAISVSVDRPTGDAIGGTHRAWLDLHQQRLKLARVWAEWFRQYDVLLCPVMPMAAFAHNHAGTIADRYVTINGEARNHVQTLGWTGLVGVVYLPSTVVPVGRTAAGMPIGAQLVGPYLEDRTPLFLAGQLSGLLGGYQPPPIARA